MKENIKAFITVFISTRTKKFRVQITDEKGTYEVTIGGKSWSEGKGREHEKRILQKCEKLISRLQNQLFESYKG
jgi:hypothetical protein